MAVACIAQSKVTGYVTYPGYYVYGTGLRYAAASGTPTAAGAGAQGIGGHSGPMVAAASNSYPRSLAYPVVLPSGFLLDTPEVAAVKAAHLNAIRNTRAAIVRSAIAAGSYGPGAGVYGNGAEVYAPGAGVYAVANYGNGQYAYQG